jgi:KAP family P-loop domain
VDGWSPPHDYSRSQAVVMGTGYYRHLPPIPAAGNSLTRMGGLLTSPLCGWPDDRVRVLANETSPGDLPYRLVSWFSGASDVALFYYVGYGQIDADGELCLGLTDSRPEADLRAVTSLPFQAVRRALAASDAVVKIVILDCCFSGLAAGPVDLRFSEEVTDRTAGTGAFTLAVAGPYGTVWFEADSESARPETIFTKYLADLVEAGIPGEGPWLRLDQLAARLREALARDGRPIPVERSVGNARDFVFAHNAAPARSAVPVSAPPAAAGRTGPDRVAASAEPATTLPARRPLPDVCSDSPSPKDMIGAAADVLILADLIAAADTAPPIAIAIIGDWGAGKSSVLLQIEHRVDELAGIASERPKDSPFAASVRQVRLNAWDYSDDQVWSGIIERLFAALAADPGQAAPASPGVLAEGAELRQELVRLEAREQRLTAGLEAADQDRRALGLLSWLWSPAQLRRLISTAVRDLISDLPSILVALAVWAVLGLVAYGAWSWWGAQIGAAAAAAAAVLGPALAVARRVWRREQAFPDAPGRLRRSLADQRRELSQQIAERKERLALIDASVRLSAFLSDRAASSAYREHRGIVGQVRQDLGRLADDLASARKEWAAAGSLGLPPLERIVLYIDDLDRCAPRRVVEVLEAINLMLSFDLFVVVVAVEAQWLIGSLTAYYRDLFGAASGRDSALAPGQPVSIPDPASPADFLDKIFQIAYALVQPERSALGRYLESLLPPSDAAGGYLAATSPGPGQSEAAPGPTADPPSGAAGQDSGAWPRAGERGQSDASPQRLRVSQREIDFMIRLSPLLPTPRAAKRLANLYRLVRIGIPHAELASFIGSAAGAPYQAVQILLAVLAGRPAAAQRVFTELMRAPADSDILVILAKAGSADSPHAASCAEIATELARLAEQVPVEVRAGSYQPWCPVLARYSFHTHAMAGRPGP